MRTNTWFTLPLLIAAFLIATNASAQIEKQSFDTGVARFNAGDFKGAIQSFNSAIQLNPNSISSFMNRGSTYLKLAGQDRANARTHLDSAISDYDKVIELRPTAPAYLNRGLAKSNRADAIGSSSPGPVGDLLRRADYKGANDDFNKVIGLTPADPAAFMSRGDLLRKMGTSGLYSESIAPTYWKSAREDYNKTIELNPKNGAAYAQRGYVSAELGDLAGAVADWAKATEVDPGTKATVEAAIKRAGFSKACASSLSRTQVASIFGTNCP